MKEKEGHVHWWPFSPPKEKDLQLNKIMADNELEIESNNPGGTTQSNKKQQTSTASVIIIIVLGVGWLSSFIINAVLLSPEDWSMHKFTVSRAGGLINIQDTFYSNGHYQWQGTDTDQKDFWIDPNDYINDITRARGFGWTALVTLVLAGMSGTAYVVAKMYLKKERKIWVLSVSFGLLFLTSGLSLFASFYALDVKSNIGGLDIEGSRKMTAGAIIQFVALGFTFLAAIGCLTTLCCCRDMLHPMFSGVAQASLAMPHASTKHNNEEIQPLKTLAL